MNNKELHQTFSCHANSMTGASTREWPGRKACVVTTLLLFLTSALTWAQPNGTGTYYQSADGNKGKVIDCTEKGYMLNDSVLRFAKVVVGI